MKEKKLDENFEIIRHFPLRCDRYDNDSSNFLSYVFLKISAFRYVQGETTEFKMATEVSNPHTFFFSFHVLAT